MIKYRSDKEISFRMSSDDHYAIIADLMCLAEHGVMST